MTAPPRAEDLITRTDAAKFLDLHVNTFDRAARKARLRRFRRTGDARIFFLRTEVEGLDPIIEVTDHA